MFVLFPFLADAVSILIFAALGQRTHDGLSTPSGSLEVAAPFLLALVAGWLVARAWRSPASLATGVVVWAVTVAGGMLLRRTVFDRGTATSFVIVAALFLALFLLGWRLVVAVLARRGGATAPPERADQAR